MDRIQAQNPAKQGDWPKEARKRCPVSDSGRHEGTALPLRPPGCLSTSTLFPPNKHWTCFITFRPCGNSFLQSRRARALSPATGPVARIQHPTSVSGQGLKSCFKPLLAEATRDQDTFVLEHCGESRPKTGGGVTQSFQATHWKDTWFPFRPRR